MTADPGIDEQASCRQCGGTYTFYEPSALEVCAECGHNRQNRHPWYQRAACRGKPTDLFFLSRDSPPAAANAAIKICRSCEVQAECLQFALDTGEEIGIWGGTTGADRRRLLFRQRLQAITRRCVGCQTAFTTMNRGKQWCSRGCYSRHKQHPARRRSRA